MTQSNSILMIILLPRVEKCFESEKCTYHNLQVEDVVGEMNPNICHDRKVAFIHNPKAAGTSFRHWFGISGPHNHGFPTINIPLEIWHSYTSIVVVRDPIERALSAYRFHTDENYNGSYLLRYPDLRSWDPNKWFVEMINNQIYVLACQYKYTMHLQSNKRPDYLFHFETMDTSELAKHLGMKEQFPVKNAGKNKKFVDLSEDMYYSLVDYYKVDYLLFGYKPKSYREFMVGQLAV
ncbi:sulfotransferase family 2 domain-containing protein [uncultured Roseibium sp.]|uniref:sulfotransferase family 2 domain-containing protein n=1 Tax=uncultured Roseibium sp. TaxID=1936171 RepID=UPI0032175AF5